MINEDWSGYPDVEGAFIDEQKKIGYLVRGVSALGSGSTEAFYQELKDHLGTLDEILEEPEGLADWTGTDGTRGQTISMAAMAENRVYLRQETILIPDKNLAVSLSAEYTDETYTEEVKTNLLRMRDSLTVQIGNQDYVSGNVFVAGDESQLCFREDGSFYYYQHKSDHSQNYFTGTYEVHYGQAAYDYLIRSEELSLSQEALEQVITDNMDGYHIKDGGAGDMSRLLEGMGITENSAPAQTYQVCKDTFYVIVLHNDTLVLTGGEAQEGGYDSTAENLSSNSISHHPDFNYRRCSFSTRIISLKSIGFPICPSIPASRHLSISSRKTLAVAAIIGIVSAFARPLPRISRVASYPSISGICTSIRIRSYFSGCCL